MAELAALRIPRILTEHPRVLARRRPENSQNRSPPQAQNTPGSVEATRFLVLFLENRFHFGAKVTPKIEGKKPQKCSIKSCRPGISRCHGVLPRCTTTPLFGPLVVSGTRSTGPRNFFT